MGNGERRFHDAEVTPSMKMGKSIVALRDLPAGTVLRREDLTTKSPGGGMWPYQLPEVVGRRLTAAIATDEALHPGLLEQAAE